MRSVRRANDRVDVEVVLESGIVVTDRVPDRAVPASGASDSVMRQQLILAPGAVTRLSGDELTISFDMLPDDVVFDRGQVRVTRTRRTIAVEDDATTLAHLVDGLERGIDVHPWIDRLPRERRDGARDLVADLVGWEGVVCAKGARSLQAHHWSMRGARSRGGLRPSAVAELTFEDAPANAVLGPPVSLEARRRLPIDSLSGVLRRRRSLVSYNGSAVSLQEMAQLLGHACGVTGEAALGDRQLPLRAYPSAGALYAVDVHVLPSLVEGLPGGAYRYDPPRHVLEPVKHERTELASLCLPDVRDVVTGAAAMIALTIAIPRAIQKYGEESYRLLVAEAGCIAENLVLVAHALGLRAGPFTGVFDGLVDRALGTSDDRRRFAVSVLIGRDQGRP